MQKYLLLLVALTLSACGNEQPESTGPATDETPAEAADAAAEQSREAAQGDDASADSGADEVMQVVEESAAEQPADEGDEPILLAQADDPAAARDWKYKEGEHFARMVPSQPTWGGADKIEVAEFFWYGCPHCFTFEPYLARWKAQKDPNVRFVKIPAMWNPALELHARMFFVEEIFARSGDIENPDAFRNMVFEEYHNRGNRMASVKSIYQLFERVGISREDFDKTWNSFEVDQNLRKAQDLARRYSIASVPTVVVNGKYRTGGQEAGSYNNLIEIINELTERESLR